MKSLAVLHVVNMELIGEQNSWEAASPKAFYSHFKECLSCLVRNMGTEKRRANPPEGAGKRAVWSGPSGQVEGAV